MEDQYRVWALVRYARTLAPKDGVPIFEVGVAFVGKWSPKSYLEDPSQRFDIANSVTAAKTLSEEADEMLGPMRSISDREYTRHNIPVDMVLETLDEKGAVSSSESTVSENISSKGATIFTTMEVPIGRFIRLTSPQSQITVYAAVRARSTGADGIARIHVEFIDQEWPL